MAIMEPIKKAEIQRAIDENLCIYVHFYTVIIGPSFLKWADEEQDTVLALAYTGPM